MSTRKKHKNQSARQKHSAGGGYWIAGTHACQAALANPEREVLRILVTQNAHMRLDQGAQALAEVVSPQEIERVVGEHTVHQGIALQLSPLPETFLEDVLHAEEKRPLLVLDQVTDPRNIGAMLRSCAAFGVAALVTTQDNTPPETAVLAKAACGGLDIVPWVRVVNLAKALEQMKQAGYWVAGMDGTADKALAQAKLGPDTALVMGAEGKGLRRLTQEACDHHVKLEMSEEMESLNVSNAAAIALHTLYVNANV